MFHLPVRRQCFSLIGLGLMHALCLTQAVCLTHSATAQSWDRKQAADKIAPAGITADHVNQQGQWMVEYRYMNSYLDGNRIGTTRISDLDAIGPAGPPSGIVVDGIQTNAGATPTSMTAERHIANVMYGATENVTLYTMLSLPSLTMDQIRGDDNLPRGTSFTTHNCGLGDTTLGALLRLYSTCDQDLILNLGCSVPTGDIFRETTVPTSGAELQALPYPLRLGSGTFNARPGITYRRYWDWYSWGAQFQTDLPIGHNYRDYSVSNEFRLNSWTSVLLTENWAVSMRGEHLWRTAYDGADPAATGLFTSTNVESFRGGYWYSCGFGSQVIWNRQHFNAEVVPTFHQKLDGIQLETDLTLIASWSTAW